MHESIRKFTQFVFFNHEVIYQQNPLLQYVTNELLRGGFFRPTFLAVGLGRGKTSARGKCREGEREREAHALPNPI